MYLRYAGCTKQAFESFVISRGQVTKCLHVPCQESLDTWYIMVPSTSKKPRQRSKSKQTDKAIPDPTTSEEELRKYYASNRRSRLIIFAICVLFRLGNASVTRTYDNPDEYWQAQEVAHRLVFGYPFFKAINILE